MKNHACVLKCAVFVILISKEISMHVVFESGDAAVESLVKQGHMKQWIHDGEVYVSYKEVFHGKEEAMSTDKSVISQALCNSCVC